MTAPFRRVLAALSACLLVAACVAPQTGGAPQIEASAAPGSPAFLAREQARAHRQLGLGLEAAGDIAGAVGEFEAALTLGPAGEVYREAGEAAVARHDALVADLTALLEPHATQDGVYMASSSWVISARNPAKNP